MVCVFVPGACVYAEGRGQGAEHLRFVPISSAHALGRIAHNGYALASEPRITPSDLPALEEEEGARLRDRRYNAMFDALRDDPALREWAMALADRDVIGGSLTNDEAGLLRETDRLLRGETTTNAYQRIAGLIYRVAGPPDAKLALISQVTAARKQIERGRAKDMWGRLLIGACSLLMGYDSFRAEGHLDKQIEQIYRGGRVDNDYQYTLSVVGFLGQVPGIILSYWGQRELEHGINALKDLESTPTPPEPRALEPRAPRRPRRRGQLIPAR